MIIEIKYRVHKERKVLDNQFTNNNCILRLDCFFFSFGIVFINLFTSVLFLCKANIKDFSFRKTVKC